MEINTNPQYPDSLLSLLQQVKENHIPQPLTRKRGRQVTYSSLSFLLLAVVAVVCRTFKESELHSLLSKDSRLLQTLGFAKVPHRTTIFRRLESLLDDARYQVNALGAVIVDEVQPQEDRSQLGVIDGRMYEAQGPLWHKLDREKGIVPSGLRNVDTESYWSKSNYRGWVQGYRLLLQGLAFPQPVPIFADFTSNEESEIAIAREALDEGELKITPVLLGDSSFGVEDFSREYRERGGYLLTPLQLPEERRSWKNDLYDYRKETIELLFQRVMQVYDLRECPAKGLGRNGAYVLASVWIYQITYLANYRQGKPLAEIKDSIDSARWRLAS